MERTPALAARIGLFARVDVSSEIVWDFRDFLWVTRGHLSRDYRDKSIRVWRTVPGPFYGYFADLRTPVLWIVEDPVSAARIQLEGGSALCLNGTHLSPDLQGELARMVVLMARTGRGPPQMRVALDPDAAQQGADMTHLLTNRYGYDTMWVPLVKDIKDMEPDELAGVMV
jgi:hypothetical protein